MHVGILGGGLAGLSSAVFLQQKGIYPNVYEVNDDVAGFPTRAEVLMPVYSKPISDFFNYIDNKFGLTVKPHGELRRIVWHTYNATASAVGKLGYITLRGRDKNSLDRQIAASLAGRVNLASVCSLRNLQDKYEWVIDATGQAGNYRHQPRSICFRGGTIRGRFEPKTMHIWHTSEATPNGFAYLVPQSSRLASIFIVIPLSENDSSNRYLTSLWPLIQKGLGFEPDLLTIEEFRRVHSDYLPHVKEKILYAGDSLGSAVPFLGQGQFLAIATAYSAVEKVFGLPGYYHTLRFVEKHLDRMRIIRHALDTWGDFMFDNVVRAMRVGATPFFACKHNLLSVVSFILRPYTQFIQR